MTSVPNSSRLSVAWWKASASGAQSDCVECGLLGDVVAVRDSKHPAGPALIFGRDALAAMVGAVATGAL
ncbi:DUF397 domain-containing protein [Streptomyces cyaneofuscatus]|uniref:DUF397 domain-containing protein n=1 Tax=Streptomyces cyaneofuscatus TaxID=66883 RepID=UPI003805F609